MPRHSPMILALCSLSLLCAAACSHTKPVEPDHAQDSFWSEVHSAKQESNSEEQVASSKSMGGTLDRAEVVAFLDQGPAQMLSQVPVMPLLDGEDLLGYRLEAFFPGNPMFQDVDMQMGDVVVSVNGRRIVRPDDLFQVWEALRTAPYLQIDVIRDNTLRTLSWDIVDS